MKKLVVFDWDETLCNSAENELYNGAKELLNKLIENGIQFCILTARPGRDPKESIFNKLKQNGIEIQQEDIFWVGSETYIDDQTSGKAKADKILDLKNSKNLAINDILFVDDKWEYVEEVKKVGFETLLVPENCNPDNCEGLVKVANNNRKEFFQEVEQKILSVDAEQDLSSAKTNKSTNRKLKGALIGTAIVFGGLCLAGGIAAAIVFSGGLAAPVLLGLGVALKTLGVFGFSAAGAGFLGGVLGIGAGIGAKVSASQKSTAENSPETDQLQPSKRNSSSAHVLKNNNPNSNKQSTVKSSLISVDLHSTEASTKKKEKKKKESSRGCLAFLSHFCRRKNHSQTETSVPQEDKRSSLIV